MIHSELPLGYRWATELEAQNWTALPDVVQVRVGGTDDDPWTDLAVPIALGGGIMLTRAQLSAWAGRELSDADLARLQGALPHSTLPDTVGTIVSSWDD